MSAKQPWRDEETLKFLYNQKRLSINGVADYLNCSGGAVRWWMNRHEIPRRGFDAGNLDAPYRDKEILQEYYIEKSLTTREVAEELDCSCETVREWLHRHDIPTRKRGGGNRVPWAGFRTNTDGYEEWAARSGGVSKRVLVHRLLAVSIHGYEPVCDRHIHHRNEIRWDNRPENIDVLTPSEHSQIHNRGGGA